MRLGSHFTEKQKAVLSMSHKGKPAWNKGKTMTDEYRAKDSAAHCLYWASPGAKEAKEQQSAAMKRTLAERFPPRNWKGGRTVWKRKQNAKRRVLGFVPMNEPFDGCEGHHVDNEQIIYMPHALHRSIYHRQTDGRGMAKINAIAYNFLFKQEVEAAITARENL
jgi:hypothetical protein